MTKRKRRSPGRAEAHLRLQIEDCRLKKRKPPRKPGKKLQYKVDPKNKRILILRNGTRIKQKEGLDLFLSSGGVVYALTKSGLRRRRIDYCRKRRYGKKSRNGVPNGRRYPYVTFRRGTYPVHILQVEIWIRPRRKGEEVDHLDGNIDNFALENLEIVTREENNRRRKILNAMRKAARDLHDPSLDPKNMSPERLQKIFATLEVGDPTEMNERMKE